MTESERARDAATERAERAELHASRAEHVVAERKTEARQLRATLTESLPILERLAAAMPYDEGVTLGGVACRLRAALNTTGP